MIIRDHRRVNNWNSDICKITKNKIKIPVITSVNDYVQDNAKYYEYSHL